MDIYYRYNRNKEIISLLENTFEEFKKENSIPITFSDEIPPKLRDKMDDYPIDGLMGAYFLETKHIVIYLQGINRVANDMGSKFKISNLYENLMIIVILHEIGHYWFDNIAFTARFNCYKDLPKVSTMDNPSIDEWVAQMFAFICIKKKKNLIKTMHELTKDQPEEYKSFRNNSADIEEFKDIVRVFQHHITIFKELKITEAIEEAQLKIEACKFNLC